MKNSIIKFVLLLSAGPAIAQQLPLSSQYYTNQFVTNPALAGTKENVNAFLTHRSQWTGIAGAPQTSYLTVDGPIQAKNIGLGLNLYSDVTDITNRIGAFANYSYKIKLSAEDNNLFFGIALGVINNKIDFSRAIVRDKDDPNIPQSGSQNQAVFSSDFGLAWRWKKLEIGAAVPQFLGSKFKYNTVDGKTTTFNLERSYQASLKYIIDIVKEKEISVYPLLMARYYENSILQYDANLVLDWKKVGWIGGTYHSNNSVAVSAGLRYKNLSIGYAYDFGMSSTRSYAGNSSELLLGFSFGKGKDNSAEETAIREEAAKKDVVQEQPKNTATNEEIAAIKTKSDSNEVEIQRLKTELAQMKTERLTATPASATNTNVTNATANTPVDPNKPREINLTENLMRTSSSNNFVDEAGLTIMGGYYIVIGSFNNKENAVKFKNANLIKGYTKTQVIQNSITKTYYVYASRFDKQPDAEAEIAKYKTEYNDAWVLKLE
jgi:type IX secretion system PorP/SprF family membrane protein